MKPRLLLAIISGAVTAAAFAPFEVPWVGLFGLIPLFIAIEGMEKNRAFIAGFAWGLAFFACTVYWVVYSMYYYGGVPFAIGVIVMALLAAYLALFIGVFAYLLRVFDSEGKRSAWTRLFFAPLLWVALEYARGWALTGFPWALIGYSAAPFSVFMQIADITGILGVSFWVVLVNAGTYITLRAVVRHEKTDAAAAAIILVVVTVGVYAYGSYRIKAVKKETAEWKRMSVSIIQGSIDQGAKWSPDEKKNTVEVYRKLSLEKPGAALTVWPETAMPFFLAYERDGLEVRVSAAELGGYLLVGAPHYERDPEGGYDKIYNSAFLIGPDGEFKARYDKFHLVPFGEYVPLKNALFFVKKLTHGIGDFTHGDGPVPLKMNGENLGVFICYEAIFPEITAKLSKNGATLLVNITNDGWFGRTTAPHQHLAMSVVRAIETRTYLVRAANTGISAVIAPDGSIVNKTALFERTALAGDVGIRQGEPTFFSENPRLVPFTAVAFSVIMILSGVLKRKRRR